MVETIVALAAMPVVGEVAKRLLDGVCFGVKRFVEPYLAAHAEKVEARAELEAFRGSPLRQLEFAQEFMKNAGGRFPSEAVKELENLWKVINAAVSCTGDAAAVEGGYPYSVAEDREWFSRFFDEARYVSDEELQVVWGRLLSERVSRPKGVNNRVLYFLRDMEKEEIETVSRALRAFLDDAFAPKSIVEQFEGMSHDLVSLMDLDVVTPQVSEFTPLVWTCTFEEGNVIHGHGADFRVAPLNETKELEMQCLSLSPEGRVMSRLCTTPLSREEKKVMCKILNNYWEGAATVEIVEEGD